MYAVCSAVSIFINVGSITGHYVKSTNGAFLLIHAPVLSSHCSSEIEQQQQPSNAISSPPEGWFAVRQLQRVRATLGRWSECGGVSRLNSILPASRRTCLPLPLSNLLILPYSQYQKQALRSTQPSTARLLVRRRGKVRASMRSELWSGATEHSARVFVHHWCFCASCLLRCSLPRSRWRWWSVRADGTDGCQSEWASLD